MFGSGFGGKKAPDSPGELALQLSKEDDKNAKTTGSSGASVHGFDPSALERAAKAAKELDASRNAKDALRLITLQEQTKQKENETDRARFQAMQQELAIKRIEQEEISAAHTLERQTEHERQRANYKDELERQRMVEQLNAQRKIADEERQKNEASLARQEAMRRKTLEHEAELRQRTEMARAKAEAEGRILQERENHDLQMERRRLEMLEYRTTVLEGIRLAGSTIGNGLSDYLTDSVKLKNTALTISGIAFGLAAARVSTGVAGRYIEARLGKPSLVRETTRGDVLSAVRAPSAVLKRFFGSPASADGAMKSLVLAPALESRLRRVATSTINTKLNKAPFRHLLLHGPPGTGKTMFAKGLARQSGLNYAIMTGGDVAPLGKDAVTEIHKLFDWAETTNKGVLLFIDEADAFLRKRSGGVISEDLRNALNAFLYRTGEASRKVMVVYASNQPEQFDWAINDRIDDMVAFDLPSLEERQRMLAHYLGEYILHPPAGAKTITVDGVDETVIRAVAEATKGFSGREISKLAIAWQAAAYGTKEAVLDKALFLQVLEEAKASKATKLSWLSAAEVQQLANTGK